MKCAIVIVLIAVAGVACGGGKDSSPTAPTVNVPFRTVDLRAGTGTDAALGRSATVRYTGWLYSTTGADNKGTQFDTGTFTFVIGQGVVQGFSQGVVGMRVGGLRRVVIPPSLGYGAQPNGPIPGNSTLIFEIELLSLQ